MVTGEKKTVFTLKKLSQRGTQTHKETPSIGEVMVGECVIETSIGTVLGEPGREPHSPGD